MPRPDPALLDPARYPFSCTIEPRFGDLDTNLHVNNAAIAGILEDARVRFHAASGFHASLDGLGAMVASLSIDYLGQTFYPDPIRIHVAPLELGRTSYRVAKLMMQGERTVVFAQAVMVCIADGRPAPIPERFRAAVQPWMIRP